MFQGRHKSELTNHGTITPKSRKNVITLIKRKQVEAGLFKRVLFNSAMQT